MAAKIFHLAIVSASLAISVNPLGVAQALPDRASYFCYQQSAYGEVTNLNELCRKNPDLPPKSAVKPASTTTFQPRSQANSTSEKPKQSVKKRVIIKDEARRVFDFSNLSYADGVLTGSARNKTRALIADGSLIFEVQASRDKVNWKVVDTGSTCLLNDSLPPRKTTTFRRSTFDGDRIIITGVDSSISCRR